MRGRRMLSRMKSVGKVKPRKFVLRPYRRILTWYESYYMSGDSIGKGVVMNLSCSGLRVLGDHALAPGMEVSVRFSTDEKAAPVEVLKASVRWANEYEFGLQIDHLAPGAASRIARLVVDQARTLRRDG